MMNKELIGKTINGEPKGVPAHIFNQDKFEGKIYTASGWPLYCYVSPCQITLTDPKNSFDDLGRHHCGFRADVINKFLIFSIYTKGFKGDCQQKHPDLFAAELLKSSFNYFKRQNTQINSVLCHWEAEAADTYQQFINALDWDQNPEPSIDQQLEAAKQTWTAKQIASFGYTKITPKYFIWTNLPNNPAVYCLFTKP